SLAEHGDGGGTLAASAVRSVGRRGAGFRRAGGPGWLLAAGGLAGDGNRLDPAEGVLGPRVCDRVSAGGTRCGLFPAPPTPCDQHDPRRESAVDSRCPAAAHATRRSDLSDGPSHTGLRDP